MGLVAVALLAWSGAASAHSGHKKPAAKPAANAAPAATEAAPLATPLSAPPAAALPLDIGGPFALVDHKGNAVTDRDFRGRFLLVFFGYANCPGVCPVGLRTMTEAFDLLGAKSGAVMPVLITVDPERDSLATLGPALAKIHPRLIGLTGTPEQLAAARRAYKLGAKITGRDLNGGALFQHGTFIYLIGPDGKFLTLFPPVVDPAALAAAIARYMS
jgi:protein SCO1/2